MTQNICIDNDCLNNLKQITNTINPKSIFIVTGEKSFDTCGANSIISDILKNTLTVRFSDFNKNPKLEDVIKGIDLFKKSNCDLVLAVGGGSVIDMAKLINIFAHQKCNPLAIINSEEFINEKGKPLIAIPTTAGAGSEATHFAVLYVDNKKHSIAHEYILPDYVVIYPPFTYNLPSYITACSGIDALSQAIEAMWSINSNTESISYSKKAITLIINNLYLAVKNNDHKARIAMAEASFLAGKAINIAKTTGPHAVSYPFTSYFNIPHGHAVALTLPSFFEFNFNLTQKDCNDTRGVLYVKETLNDICKIIGFNINEIKLQLVRYFVSLGLEMDIQKILNYSEYNSDLILKNINHSRIKNNPRTVNKDNIATLLR